MKILKNIDKILYFKEKKKIRPIDKNSYIKFGNNDFGRIAQHYFIWINIKLLTKKKLIFIQIKY